MQPPRDFKFPFRPYESQSAFMNRMYEQIDAGGVAIFESPTGTGKSLSIICSALLWLQERGLQGSKPTLSAAAEPPKVDANSVPSWVDEQFSAIQKVHHVSKKKIQKRNDRLKRFTGEHQKRTRKADEIVPESFEVEYDSGNEDSKSGTLKDVDSDESDGEDAPLITKVFYASRTHSQLAQFASEIKRCTSAADVHAVTLGSRKALCINESVRELQSVPRINDRCLELQQQRSTDAGCPFLKDAALRVVRDRLLANVCDVDEATLIGRNARGCTYYGSRKAAAQAEFVLLPYNMLLHQATRESLGVDLKDNIVVLDEAHNVIDAILEMHSVTLSAAQLQLALSQLKAYEARYKDRLKLKNLWYIRQILLIIDLLLGALKTPHKSGDPSIHSVNDFLFGAGFDNFNLIKIEKFFKLSGIVRKLNGFIDAFLQNSADSASVDAASRHRPAMSVVEDFFICLSNPSSAGRIAIDCAARTLQYVQLDPEPCMRVIVQQARAVIFAGGTLSPIDDLAVQLLGDAASRVVCHQWDHVVPTNHVLALSVPCGATGQPFDFTFAKRSIPALIAELGEAVISLASLVPDGIVLFFPSYAYEEEVMRAWGTTGLLARLEKLKCVLREPRGQVAGVDEVLRAFRVHVETPRVTGRTTGALLSCVVGGKLSEGINFADGLGRCVVMVGLPYANRSDLVLRERMQYLDSKYAKPNRQRPGEDFYESLCIRSVNQSIGRVIRHAADYASIVLLDERYCKPATIAKLPRWIGKNHSCVAAFEQVRSRVQGFFTDPWKVQQQTEIEARRVAAARRGDK